MTHSVRLSVCRSVGRSVGHTLLFRRYGRFLCYCSCPNAWVRLCHHCSCPPARDFGSCIRPCLNSKRFRITAPARLSATRVPCIRPCSILFLLQPTCSPLGGLYTSFFLAKHLSFLLYPFLLSLFFTFLIAFCLSLFLPFGQRPRRGR